MILKILWKKL